MKKVLSLLLCMMVLFAATACGNQPGASSGSKEPAASSSSAPGNSSTSASSTMTMDQYLSTMGDQLDQLNETLKDSGMGIKIITRDGALVYQYQYTIDVGDKDAAKAALEQGIGSMDSTFESELTNIRAAVPDVKSIVVEYLDKDGGILFSKEYK